MQPFLPVEVFGVIFRNEVTGEEILDVGTLRFHVDGARIAGREIMGKNGRMKPVRLKRFLLTDPKCST